MKKQIGILPLVLFCCLLPWEVAAAKPAARPSTGTLTVSPYFTSNMVLQRGMKAPVFGTASPGMPVTVNFNGQELSTVTSSTGKWQIDLEPMFAKDEPQPLTVSSGSLTITIKDVLVGEVWVLSGQSNINLPLWQCTGGGEAVATAGDYPNIRLYMSKLSSVGTTGTWLVSDSATSQYWSGVGFFFARALQQQMTDPVPVGLIQVAKNGSLIADWTTLEGNRGRFYVGNVVPIQPMAIRGVIWYQGETEADPDAYYRMLPGLIDNWRADWGQGSFPFYIVQLAPIAGRDYYAIIRDAQVSTLNEAENIQMACIIDIDTVPATEIHPPNKKPVGDRLALIARAKLYGETGLMYSGPIRDPSATTKSANSIVVGFNHVEGGMVTDDGYPPGPFMLAGSDGVFYPATAVLDQLDHTIHVSSTSVADPVSIRYGWASYPPCNLFNGAWLPASPFQLTFPPTVP